MNALHKLNYFDGISLDRDIFNQETLNDFLKLGKPIWRQVRDRIAEIFDSNNAMDESHKTVILSKINEVEMLMPVKVGDYTDFYSVVNMLIM